MDALRDKNLLNLYLEGVSDEKDIISFCSSNKYLSKEFCTDKYLQNFLNKRYPNTDFTSIKTKLLKEKETKSWKQFFLLLSYYKGLLKENFDYEYKGGDFKHQYELFTLAKGDMNILLRYAIYQDYLDIAKYALDKGAVINANTLYHAAINGNLDVIKLFVERGLDVKSKDSEIIFKAAIANGNIELLRYLKTLGVDLSKAKLGGAVHGNHLDVIKYLVKEGADIHADHENALRRAAYNGNLDIVKYLVEKGANPHIDDDVIIKAAASKEGNQEVVNYLRSL